MTEVFRSGLIILMGITVFSAGLLVIFYRAGEPMARVIILNATLGG